MSSNYKQKVLSNEKLQSICDNLFYRSRGAIDDYQNFPWHKGKGNNPSDSDQANSSQALMIDFFGCLKLSPHKDHIINSLFQTNGKDWEVVFEVSDGSLLNEKTPTQIDVVLRCSSDAIILECKFCEPNGGPCIQHSKKTREGSIQCTGNYQEQLNPVNNRISKCALSGKNILYWNYIGKLTKYDPSKEYSPCPFKNGEYQWMRNICFEKAYSERHGLQTQSFLVYYQSEKCSIHKHVSQNTYLGSLKANLIDPLKFRARSYNELLSQIIELLGSSYKGEQKIWIELEAWMQKKEMQI